MWNLVCLKLHSKGKSLPTIHNFEIIGDSSLASFTMWGKLCHSATDTVSIEQHEIYVYNIYRITWYIHVHQLYGLLIGVTFPLQLLHLLVVSSLLLPDKLFSLEVYLTVTENRIYTHQFHTDKANTFLDHWFNRKKSKLIPFSKRILFVLSLFLRLSTPKKTQTWNDSLSMDL